MKIQEFGKWLREQFQAFNKEVPTDTEHERGQAHGLKMALDAFNKVEHINWRKIPTDRKSNEPELVLALESSNNDLLIGNLKKEYPDRPDSKWWCEKPGSGVWIACDYYIPVSELLSIPKEGKEE